MQRKIVLLGLCALLVVSDALPEFGMVDADSIFRGHVSMGSLDEVVIMEDALMTRGTENVCQFYVVHHHNEPKAPFEISVKDQSKGTAELRLSRDLDCDKDPEQFAFQVEALSCAGTYSKRVRVVVDVSRPNLNAPRFSSGDSLSVSVPDAKEPGLITVIEALDEDCGLNGRICKYRIINGDDLFGIDNNGVLSNTRSLKFAEARSHVVSVQAEDCGGKSSEQPVLVVVNVQPPCKDGWSDVPDKVTYFPGTGPQTLFPSTTFKLCPRSDAPTNANKSSLEAEVELVTSHIGKGCDRDTYSTSNQRQMCGADVQALDLLDSMINEDEAMLKFEQNDGFRVVLPDNADINSPSSTFTLATWLKHAGLVDLENKGQRHEKEHIFCTADAEDKNRHHLALFVRNCKLVLLLRQESSSSSSSNIFRPAEWRWRLPQVCDNEWHHYAINVNFPDVELVVDGDKFVDDANANPEIIDDWPLRKEETKTIAAIGACWQGSEQRYAHGLRGYLAGTWLLLHANENVEVLRCLHQCSESLVLPTDTTLNALHSEALASSHSSRMLVKSSDIDDLQQTMRKIAYLNTREFPAPGMRILKIRSRIVSNEIDVEELQEQKIVLNVMQAEEPVIEIRGQQEMFRDDQEVKNGVAMFEDAIITVSSAGEVLSSSSHELDSCTIQISPPLNNDHESVLVPRVDTNIPKVHVSPSEVVFEGKSSVEVYQNLVRKAVYMNSRPVFYLNRRFELRCQHMNGRFKSNTLLFTLNIEHPVATEWPASSSELPGAKLEEPADSHRQLSSLGVEERDFILAPILHNNNNKYGGGSNAVTVTAVVFAGFLLVVVLLAMLRIKTGNNMEDELEGGEVSHHLASNEMTWDDAPLNITTNPFESVREGGEEEEDEYELDEDEYDDEDEGVDDYDEEIVEMRGRNRVNTSLEWDNTNL